MIRSVILMLSFLCVTAAAAQSSKKQLEQEKARLQKEINQYSRLLSKVRKDEKNLELIVATIDKKISSTQRVINLSNKQANLLTRNIKENTSQIVTLKEEIEVLKKDYARMIVKSYKAKNDQSRLMFLLSADNFLQAYKRLQYMQAYANYRKQQADDITVKTALLTEKNKTLEEEKKEKLTVLAQNKKQRASLKEDRSRQQELITAAQKDQNKYTADIKKRAKERSRIDRELRKIIEKEIAASNKGKKGAVKNKYFLSPEGKKLAASFKNNRNKLPWPVSEGFISRTYGVQKHPLYPGLKINSNGIRFQTPQGARARAIFNGEVVLIAKNRNGILQVHIRHGNYRTIYNNLKSVNVQKGDQVITKQELGEVFTDKSGVTEMGLIMLVDTKKLDPQKWIARK